ncbi:hypothetical protein G3RUM_00045 [Candidatus Nanosyncoccus alces]|uniref:Uncharacterized protein n=1 Tax=Candidatus Nanosyncoccus alces TaxID=2171997 RepID=A0ABY0FP14_9BACT|nr:hypothetical protein G3RUM_00045 [Candidatus Nanosyncoccus alces]
MRVFIIGPDLRRGFFMPTIEFTNIVIDRLHLINEYMTAIAIVIIIVGLRNKLTTDNRRKFVFSSIIPDNIDTIASGTPNVQ